MITGALKAKGGQKYLERQAEKNPVAFMGLVGKIIPTQIVGDLNIVTEVAKIATTRTLTVAFGKVIDVTPDSVELADLRRDESDGET